MLVEAHRGDRGISGKIWPDGSFGYSFRQIKKFSLSKKKDPAEEAYRHVENQVLRVRQANYAALRSALITNQFLYLVLAWRSASGEAAAIGLSEAIKYHKAPRAPRGSRGITGEGRKLLRSACTLLEMKVGTANLSFATLTMPPLSPGDRAICQREWGRAIQIFYQEMKREAARQGVAFVYAGCTEIQPARSRREGWNVPHLHFIFIGRIGKKWWINPKKMRNLWKRIWESRFSNSYNWQASENLQRLRKSAAGYLSKYLSKGSSYNFPSAAMDSWYPSSWQSLSLSLKRWVRRACVCARAISPILLQPDLMKKLFSRCGEKSVAITLSSGAAISVGVAGWISSSEWLEFLGAFWPEKLDFQIQ